MKKFLSILFLALCAPCYCEFTGENAEMFKKAQAVLGSVSGDFTTQKITRVPPDKVDLEVFVSGEIDTEAATKVFFEPKLYEKWALANLNVRSDGEPYRLKLTELSPIDEEGKRLKSHFDLTIPLLTTSFTRMFTVVPTRSENVTTVNAIADAVADSFLEAAKIVLKIFPAPDSKSRAWVYMKGSIVLRSWIAYSALPDKMVERETGPRLHRILDNYFKEESRVKATATKLNPIPKQTKAKRGALASDHLE